MYDDSTSKKNKKYDTDASYENDYSSDYFPNPFSSP